MAADRKRMNQVLAAIPQQKPFRFIDEIRRLDDASITATYRFPEDAFFYEGHFPENPVTPGVILVETMAQAGVTALGLYQLLKTIPVGKSFNKITPLFVFIEQVEFRHIVKPGERVIIQGEIVYFRRGSVKSKTSIHREDGTVVCHGVLTGTGVKH